MTKKHFVEIAAAFKSTRPVNDEHGRATLTWVRTVEEFSRLAAQWNPQFDEARFRRACGWGDIGTK